MFNVLKGVQAKRKGSGTIDAIDIHAPLGSLTPSEKLVVDKLGHLVQGGKLEEVFKTFDDNGSGEVEYEEFYNGLLNQDILCDNEEATKLFKVRSAGSWLD
jgi:hypothetical protein